MSTPIQRVKAVISYDGSAYLGFQKQTSTSRTITNTIEKVLKSLQISSPIVGSGRTDAGVHATGQVIHFDIPPYWEDLEKLKLNLNRKLNTIQFKHICFISTDFHARFSAKKRLYRYVFKTVKPSIFEQRYVSCYSSFCRTKLQEALSCFIGEHDFDMFRKTGTHTHTSIREIYKAHYIQRGNYHYIYFEANGFLRAQVRMMIETVMCYAQDDLILNQIEKQLLCTHKYNTKLAPPEGLYLARVIY